MWLLQTKASKVQRVKGFHCGGGWGGFFDILRKRGRSLDPPLRVELDLIGAHSQSADGMDKMINQVEVAQPAGKPNNRPSNCSTISWSLWCIGQSSAHITEHCSPSITARLVRRHGRSNGIETENKRKLVGGERGWGKIHLENVLWVGVHMWYAHTLPAADPRQQSGFNGPCASLISLLAFALLCGCKLQTGHPTSVKYVF